MKKIIFLLLIFLISCSEKKEIKSQTTNDAISHFQYLCNLKLPENLDFCGERIPLEIPEVKERAEREFYLLLQQPGQIILYLKRAGKYFPLFEKILKEKGLPEDIKYLSVAESALYMARSPKDALGLWQFIPETARKMGLQVDEYVDERCHPEKSTYAAIKYLLEGYNQHKSWILAAAGYNMGHTNLLNNIYFQNFSDYFELFLNEETSRYIFRIVVIKEIMKNSEKYGFKLDSCEIYKPEKYKIIKWNGEIPNLAEWAREHKTTYKNIKLLNPWILKRSLPKPQKGFYYEIAIPE